MLLISCLFSYRQQNNKINKQKILFTHSFRTSFMSKNAVLFHKSSFRKKPHCVCNCETAPAFLMVAYRCLSGKGFNIYKAFCAAGIRVAGFQRRERYIVYKCKKPCRKDPYATRVQLSFLVQKYSFLGTGVKEKIPDFEFYKSEKERGR